MRTTLPVAALLLAACEPVLTGPAPTADGLDPALVCNDQLETRLTLTGAALRPLPEGNLDAPTLTIPRVTLLPQGALADGPAPTATVDLLSTTTWLDESTLEVVITPALAIEAGVFDVQVANPDGQAATLAGALAVAPPPTLALVDPALTCVDQRDRQLVLTGTGFLQVGELLPLVELGGILRTPDALSDCTPLAGPVEGQSCRTLTVTLPQDALGAGVHTATVTNPETAGCASVETVRFEVVPEPIATAIEVQPACTEQGDRTFVVSGAGFVVLADGTTPTVQIGATTLEVDEARGCAPLTGPAGGQTCDTLELTLPAGAEPPGLPDVIVHNPAPADCSSAPIPLELVDIPVLELVAADLVCLEQGARELVLTGQEFVRLADGSLPLVEIGDAFAQVADAANGCEPLLGPAGGDRCTELVLTVPAEAVDAGVHEVIVTNPPVADCASEDAVALEVVPAPTLDEVVPLLTCVDQGDQEVLLRGAGFVVLADGTLPIVDVGGWRAEATEAAGCVDLEGPAGGQSCTELLAPLPQDAVDPGLHDVAVTNPAETDCQTLEAVALATEPAPVLLSVDDPLVCDADGGVSLALSGTGFLRVGEALPVATAGGVALTTAGVADCEAVSGVAGAERCETLLVTGPAGALATGVLDLQVANPDAFGCTSNDDVQVENLPPPTVTALLPEAVCSEAGDVEMDVRGTGFVSMGGGLPVVRIGGVSFAPDGAAGCASLALAAGEVCDSLRVSIPAGTFPTLGVEDVVVDNAPMAACASSGGPGLAVIPPPIVADVAPGLTCSGEDLTLSGSGFTNSATVTVGGAVATVISAGPTSLVVEIPPSLADGASYDVAVTTPGGCEDVAAGAVALVAPPSVHQVDQQLTCDGLQTELRLTGETFLVTGGVQPTVRVGGVELDVVGRSGCVPITGGQSCTGLVARAAADALPLGLHRVVVTNPPPADCTSDDSVFIEVIGAPVATRTVPAEQCWEVGTFGLVVEGGGFLSIDGALPQVQIGGERFDAIAVDGCTPLDGPAGGALCSAVEIEVPEATWDAAQTLPVTVTNPAPAACESEEAVDFTLYDPPRVTGLEPDRVCYGGLDVRVLGTGFIDGAAVAVGGVPAQAVVYEGPTSLLVTLPEPMTPGFYDVTVTNPDTCDHTLEDGLEVVTPPIVFFVDPPTTYSGIAVQGTVYASGLDDNEGVDSLWLIDRETGLRTDLDYTWDAVEPDRVYALIPSGLDRGGYDAFLVDGVGCEVSLPGALFAETELTIAVDEVVDPFGWSDDDTPVQIAGDGFSDLPRVYLNPVDATENTTATELSSVVYQAPTALDAVVPDGLAVGPYDVLVINPDGAVGLLEGGFAVTADPPPVIDTASPGTVSSQAPVDVTLFGASFRDPEVVWTCVDPGSGASADWVSPTVSWEDGAAVVRLPADQIGGAVCVARLTNDDGTFARYAAVSVTNPSQNLYPFRAAPLLTTARRAPAAFAGRPTRKSRYLYAVGGDAGSPAGALASVERARVDLYGNLAEWSALPDPLPAPRTLAAYASADRFVYVVGGHDGARAVDTVLRAQVLDPLAAPEIVDVDIDYGDGTGLGGGTRLYRVAATFPPSWATNPGGESLASDPLVVRLPDLDEGLLVRLTWSAVPGATGYRVYRSPEPDVGSNQEVLVAQVSGTTWLDDDSATPALGERPLPPGALGAWEVVATLPSPLTAACAAVTQHPADGPGAYTLFVAGGVDGNGAARNEVWAARLSAGADGAQLVSAFALANRLGTARSECGAYATSAALHSRIANNAPWLYIGGGRTAGGTTGEVDAFRVAAAGALDLRYAVPSAPSRAGSAFGHASNFLYVFGGGPSPVSNGRSAEICDACGGGPPDPPDLRNWNALGLDLNAARYLPGSAQESSVFFILGGQTDGAAASRLVDWTNY